MEATTSTSNSIKNPPPAIVAPSVPSVLLPELLSFSPHFLLDDIVNSANDVVGRAVDAIETFLLRWVEEQPPGGAWENTTELEQGLVSFQTLLEFHTDIAFDFFEAWSLRNIFKVPEELEIVVPHQEGLDLDAAQGEKGKQTEDELMDEIEELRKQVDNQHRLKRLYTRAVHKSSIQAARAQRHLQQLSFLQSLVTSPSQPLSALPPHISELFNAIQHLPALDLSRAEVPPSDPAKRQWEIGKAGYMSWAISQLIERARSMEAEKSDKETEGSVMASALVEEANAIGRPEDVKDALGFVLGSQG